MHNTIENIARALSKSPLFANKQKNNHYVKSKTLEESIKRLLGNVDIAIKVLNYAKEQSENNENFLFTAPDLHLLATVKDGVMFGNTLLPGMDKIHLTVSKELKNNIPTSEKIISNLNPNNLNPNLLTTVAEIGKFLLKDNMFAALKDANQYNVLSEYFDILKSAKYNFYSAQKAIESDKPENKYTVPLHELNHAFSVLVLVKQLKSLTSVQKELQSILDLSITNNTKEQDALKNVLQQEGLVAKKSLSIFQPLVSKKLQKVIGTLLTNKDNRDESQDASQHRQPLNSLNLNTLPVNESKLNEGTRSIFPRISVNSCKSPSPSIKSFKSFTSPPPSYLEASEGKTPNANPYSRK